MSTFKPGEIGIGDIVDLADIHNVTVTDTSFLSQSAKVRYYDPRIGETIERNVGFGEIYGHRRPEGRVYPNPDLPRYGLSTGYDPVADGYPAIGSEQMDLPLDTSAPVLDDSFDHLLVGEFQNCSSDRMRYALLKDCLAAGKRVSPLIISRIRRTWDRQPPRQLRDLLSC